MRQGKFVGNNVQVLEGHGVVEEAGFLSCQAGGVDVGALESGIVLREFLTPVRK